jgi:lipopolysaccharide/colanic/teichoic acid biosynthesis glycosyltransferase
MTARSEIASPGFSGIDPIEWPRLEFQPPSPNGFVYGFLFRFVGSIASVLIGIVVMIGLGAWNGWVLRPWMLEINGVIVVLLVFLTEHFRSRVYERFTVEAETGRPDEVLAPTWETLRTGNAFYGDGGRVPQSAIVDVLTGVIALVALWPILVLVAVLVKLDSRGPVLSYTLCRGQGGRVFKLYKFRTMYSPDSPEMTNIRAIQDQPFEPGPVFKIANDPRITSAGRYLRKTSLNELPQLWNVVTGSMSVVGTRPLPINYTEHLDRALLAKRDEFKPGLVAWFDYDSKTASIERRLVEEIIFMETSFPGGTLRYFFRTLHMALIGSSAM